jgi:methylmalonyl-CoA mutase cobalamin-binding subunit
MQRIQRLSTTQSSPEVARVALQALGRVAPSLRQGGYVLKSLESYMTQLYAALLVPDTRELDDVVSAMRKAEITNTIIIEAYVPVLARQMGDAWLSDALDFSAVTIGTARLQGLVKRLEIPWIAPDGTLAIIQPACLVGVPLGVQHTLGSSILAGQLRQKGVFVQLELELTCELLIDEMTQKSFAAILLSASSEEHSKMIRALVACAHECSRSTPIIIGGPILEFTNNILGDTQADFATSDVAEAMTFAGIHALKGQAVLEAEEVTN